MICEGEALAFIFRGSRRQPAGGGAPFDNFESALCIVQCAICKGLFKLQSEERKNKRSVSEAESDSCKTQRVLQGKKQG